MIIQRLNLIRLAKYKGATRAHPDNWKMNVKKIFHTLHIILVDRHCMPLCMSWSPPVLHQYCLWPTLINNLSYAYVLSGQASSPVILVSNSTVNYALPLSLYLSVTMVTTQSKQSSNQIKTEGNSLANTWLVVVGTTLQPQADTSTWESLHSCTYGLSPTHTTTHILSGFKSMRKFAQAIRSRICRFPWWVSVLTTSPSVWA